MYRGFRIEISEQDREMLKPYERRHVSPATIVSDAEMTQVLSTEDASQVMNAWFKAYKADVFISHSSKDADLARSVAGVFESIGLHAFIDSDVWGRVENLQKKIDNKFAVLQSDASGPTYNYDLRNVTTSYVHAMLYSSITKMINNAECFVFVGTDNSMTCSFNNIIETKSPWLFHELNISNTISLRLPERKHQNFSKFAQDEAPILANESIQYTFTVEADRLRQVSVKKIIESMNWSKLKDVSSPQFALDILYGVN